MVSFEFMHIISGGLYSPIAIRRHNIVDPELLADLLDAQVSDIGIQLLRGHGRRDGSGQVHQARRLVVSGIAPTVALATLLRAIGVQLRFSALRAAAAFVVRWWCGILLGAVFATYATATPERDGVGTRAAGVVSPRHLAAVVRVW